MSVSGISYFIIRFQICPSNIWRQPHIRVPKFIHQSSNERHFSSFFAKPLTLYPRPTPSQLVISSTDLILISTDRALRGGVTALIRTRRHRSSSTQITATSSILDDYARRERTSANRGIAAARWKSNRKFAICAIGDVALLLSYSIYCSYYCSHWSHVWRL
jgi:hypothetical protein